MKLLSEKLIKTRPSIYAKVSGNFFPPFSSELKYKFLEKKLNCATNANEMANETFKENIGINFWQFVKFNRNEFF